MERRPGTIRPDEGAEISPSQTQDTRMASRTGGKLGVSFPSVDLSATKAWAEWTSRPVRRRLKHPSGNDHSSDPSTALWWGRSWAETEH